MQEKSDAQLLREYARRGSESAFREIVVRHTDLIYSSALRQVTSPDLARDVAQSVFTDLARKAKSLAEMMDENASLLGWLYRSTRFAALNQLRDDRRRQSRERQVMQYLEPASELAPEWDQIKPVLDEAMVDLSEEDREALLLRYFKNHDFRAIGTTLGVSDDAAQKRVSRALERLRSHLANRGVTTTAIVLSAALATNAVPFAPAGLAATLSTTALAGTTVTTLAATSAAKTIVMTTLQKTFVTAAVIAAAGVGIYQAREASRLREQIKTLGQPHASVTEQMKQLSSERDAAMKELAALREENERLRKDRAELPKLRGEVGRLRNDSQQLAKLKSGDVNDPTLSEAVLWQERAKSLKQHTEQNPVAKIPELQFATEQDWLNAARGPLETEKDYRRAMSQLRNSMESKFASDLQPALKKFMDENKNQFPTDLSQLQPYFKSPVDEAILQRYAILPKEKIPSLGMGGQWIISQRSPVDEEFDSRVGVGPSGWGSSGTHSWRDERAKASQP